VIQESPQVGGERPRRSISPGWVLFQALQANRFQIARRLRLQSAGRKGFLSEINVGRFPILAHKTCLLSGRILVIQPVARNYAFVSSRSSVAITDEEQCTPIARNSLIRLANQRTA